MAFVLASDPLASSVSCAIGSEPRVGHDLRWLRLRGKTSELDGGVYAT
jgi:hypothetical protein